MKTPKIFEETAVIIGHSDDVAILARCIDQFQSLGFGFIFVALTQDSAGDEIYLRSLPVNERLRWGRSQDYVSDPIRLMSDSLRELSSHCKKDFVLFVDSDEFLVSNDSVAWTVEEGDVWIIDRLNAAPRIEWSADGFFPLVGLDSPLLACGEGTAAGLSQRPDRYKSWVMTQVAPKVLARWDIIQEVAVGGHDVVSKVPHVRRGVSENLLLVHIPITSFDRFKRKLSAASRFLDLHGEELQPGQAVHWRRWADLLRAGLVREEYDAQIINSKDMERLRNASQLATPREMFERKRNARSIEHG